MLSNYLHIIIIDFVRVNGLHVFNSDIPENLTVVHIPYWNRNG